MALFMVTVFSFSSCKSDTQPRLEKPTEFVLNVPPMANQTYVLSGDEDSSSDIYLTVSQPDYGMGVVTSYEVQVSKTESFEAFQSLLTVNTQAQITCSAYDFSLAVNALNGVLTEDDQDKFNGNAQDVYVRVRAFIPYCEYSSILSNVIKLHVQPYFVVRTPGKLFLIGSPSGWNINETDYILREGDNAIGSKIYSGTFDMPASPSFRFYTELGNWGKDGALPSVGANANDGDNADVQVDEDGSYIGPCVNGKGNWNITNWPGGKMKITVDLNNMKVYFEKAN